MNNVMTYKGYSARIEYDDEDGILFGQIAGIRDGVGFHADSVDDLRAAFHEAVDDYIEQQPQGPLSDEELLDVVRKNLPTTQRAN